MSCCRESCDSADADGIHNIHNDPNDHDVHSGRVATVLTGVLCAVPSSLPRGRAEAGQIAADYV